MNSVQLSFNFICLIIHVIENQAQEVNLGGVRVGDLSVRGLRFGPSPF